MRKKICISENKKVDLSRHTTEDNIHRLPVVRINLSVNRFPEDARVRIPGYKKKKK